MKRPKPAELHQMFAAMDDAGNGDGMVDLFEVIDMLMGSSDEEEEEVSDKVFLWKCGCCLSFKQRSNEEQFKAFYAERNTDKYIQSLCILLFFAILAKGVTMATAVACKFFCFCFFVCCFVCLFVCPAQLLSLLAARLTLFVHGGFATQLNYPVRMMPPSPACCC